jgi:glycosyltransferase involved in cell wall biosynthesis
MKICLYGLHLTERELQLAKELEKRNHKCFFICNKDYDNSKACNEFETITINANLIEINFKQQIKLISFLRRTRPDIFIGDTLYPGGFLGMLCKLFKIPCLIFPIGMDIQNYPEIKYGNKTDLRKNIMTKITTRFIDGYLFGAKETKNELYQNWKPKNNHKTWLVPSGHSTPRYKIINKNILKNKWDFNNKFIILTFSRIHPKKGIEYLIESMLQVKNKNKNAHLIIVGWVDKGFLKYKGKLEKQIKRLRLEENISFLGGFTGKKKREVFLMSDIFVIPSICEVVQITFLEALHYGLPTISTPVGHNTDILNKNAFGFIVPKKNPKALAEKIILLMKNENLRKIFSAKGKKIAEFHKWENCTDKWLKTIKEAKNIFQ